jgi:predicted adenine nucleotide alpha hydrolase (AANH) superfamily ATPase
MPELLARLLPCLFFMLETKDKILLHICCAGCGAFVSQLLSSDYDVTLFFYNPNIFPIEEFKKRVDTVKKIADKFNLDLIIGDYDHGQWLEKIKGRESDKEKGGRCLICYRDRLENAAKMAQSKGINNFTSTLTVSPHKLANEIIKIGQELEEKYGVKFLSQDFKKQDGFKKATALANELGLYRQNYCGCEFSRR